MERLTQELVFPGRVLVTRLNDMVQVTVTEEGLGGTIGKSFASLPAAYWCVNGIPSLTLNGGCP